MRCRGVQWITNPAYLRGFLVSNLQRVAPYCCSADEKAHPPSPAGLPAAAASSITVLALMGVVMEGDIAYRAGSLGLSLPILRSVDWQGPQIVGGTVLTKLNILAYSLIVLANDADRPAGRST